VSSPIGIGSARSIEFNLPTIPLWVPDQARAVIAGLTQQTMHLALVDLSGYVSEAAPVNNGTLAQSFGADPATDTGGISVTGGAASELVMGRIFSSLPYAVVMDEGREKGHPVSKEGIEAIGLWAQRKLGLSATDAKRVKYAIANTITKRGIKGTHFFDTAVDRWRPRGDEMFNALGEQIVMALTQAGSNPANGGR
jgi:hypothetical protein